MPRFKVEWEVIRTVVGEGQSLPHGDQSTVGRGTLELSGASADEVASAARASLVRDYGPLEWADVCTVELSYHVALTELETPC